MQFCVLYKCLKYRELWPSPTRICLRQIQDFEEEMSVMCASRNLRLCRKVSKFARRGSGDKIFDAKFCLRVALFYARPCDTPCLSEGTSTKCRDIFQRRQCPGVEQLKAQDVIHEASVWHAMNCCVNLKNVSIETQLGLKDGPLVLGERSERSNI